MSLVGTDYCYRGPRDVSPLSLRRILVVVSRSSFYQFQLSPFHFRLRQAFQRARTDTLTAFICW